MLKQYRYSENLQRITLEFDLIFTNLTLSLTRFFKDLSKRLMHFSCNLEHKLIFNCI